MSASSWILNIFVFNFNAMIFVYFNIFFWDFHNKYWNSFFLKSKKSVKKIYVFFVLLTFLWIFMLFFSQCIFLFINYYFLLQKIFSSLLTIFMFSCFIFFCLRPSVNTPTVMTTFPENISRLELFSTQGTNIVWYKWAFLP